MNRTSWIAVVAASVVVALVLGGLVGAEIGSRGPERSLAASSDLAAGTATEVAELQAQVEQLEEEVSTADAAVESALERLDTVNRQKAKWRRDFEREDRESDRLLTAMGHCESVVEYVNTTGFREPIGRSQEIAVGFYTRANRCLKPVGVFYSPGE